MSVISKSIQNLKQNLIVWNGISSAEISNLLNCCLDTFIILSLVCLNCSILWCKTVIYIWNLSGKSILAISRFISNSTSLQCEVYQPVLSIIAWKAQASSWSPPEPAIFLKIHPQCLGPFGKVQDTKDISM